MKNKEELQRKSITTIIRKVLETNIELMTYYKHLATDENSKRVCSKSIRQTKKALEKLPHVKHLEILVSIYNTIISGKESVFVLGGTLICSKQFDRWDKTEKGFKEFLEIEKDNKEQQRQKAEEQEITREKIRLAKEQGKKVEMVYQDGKVVPVIKENTNDKK